jgi:hypothetical protein
MSKFETQLVRLQYALESIDEAEREEVVQYIELFAAQCSSETMSLLQFHREEFNNAKSIN